MSKRKVVKSINRVAANVVVLLLIVALINRTSAQNMWDDYFTTKLSYHHVHHSKDEFAIKQDFAQASSDHTDRPHDHGNGFDALKHRHCHTHGNMHSTGEPLFWAVLNYSLPFASLLHGNTYLKSDGLFLATISTDHFRPPISA